MDDRGILTAVFAAPALAMGVLWAALSAGLADVEPHYVVKLAMPDSAGKIGLPVVEGPPDASRPKTDIGQKRTHSFSLP